MIKVTILDVTIVYPNGAMTFWDMMCGDFDHVVIDVRKRTVEEWLYQGNYMDDRDFRKRFHQWLGEIWEEKDRAIADALATAN